METVSYWVYLMKDGSVAEVERHEEGGTYQLGGTDDAALNITYNYSDVYQLFDFSIRDLHEKKAEEVIPKLEELVEKLGTRQYSDDYWAPTPGNAGYALSILLKWAKQHPDGVFEVS